MLSTTFRLSFLAFSCRATLVAMTVASVISSPVHAESLDRQLLQHAPAVLKYCHNKGYENVGVLKFRVKKGQSALTDNVGPLNLDVARKLELALVLANRVQQPLGIVHDASAVAAGISDANHLIAAGRPPLFTRRYPLAWGSEQVTPDVLLTGVIFVSEDLKSLAVGIVAFGRENALEKVAEFDADADPFDLIDAGESFLVRGALDDDEQQLARVVKTASRVRTREQMHPLKDPGAPVDLEIRYDGAPVPIEIRSGNQAFVPEPQEGQRVSIVLKRKQSSRTRYALTLKINGLNTLYKERLPDLDCAKWVLEPDLNEIEVVGFQTTNNRAEAFRVLSRAASKDREIDYGADVGTISLVVFREGKASPPPPEILLDELADDLAVLSRERFPSETPRNLSALQYQLRHLRGNSTRGLIGENGEETDRKIRTVKFQAHPIPLMSTTMTYFRSE